MKWIYFTLIFVQLTIEIIKADSIDYSNEWPGYVYDKPAETNVEVTETKVIAPIQSIEQTSVESNVRPQEQTVQPATEPQPTQTSEPIQNYDLPSIEPIVSHQEVPQIIEPAPEPQQVQSYEQPQDSYIPPVEPQETPQFAEPAPAPQVEVQQVQPQQSEQPLESYQLPAIVETETEQPQPIVQPIETPQQEINDYPQPVMYEYPHPIEPIVKPQQPYVQSPKQNEVQPEPDHPQPQQQHPTTTIVDTLLNIPDEIEHNFQHQELASQHKSSHTSHVARLKLRGSHFNSKSFTSKPCPSHTVEGKNRIVWERSLRRPHGRRLIPYTEVITTYEYFQQTPIIE